MKRIFALLVLLLIAGVTSAAPPNSSFTASKAVITGGAVTGDVNFVSTSTGNITSLVWYIDGNVSGFGEMLSTTFPWVDTPEAHAVVLRAFDNDTFVDSKPLAIIVNPALQPVPECTPRLPLPKQYNAAVFRNGDWFINTDNAGLVSSSFHFGSPNDIPVAGDFNGDGADDAAVFRPASGMWYVDTGKDGFVYMSAKFGKVGDVPLAADFGTDGIDDFVVFRPVTGMWYIDANHDGITDLSFGFGKDGDVPVVGKFN